MVERDDFRVAASITLKQPFFFESVADDDCCVACDNVTVLFRVERTLFVLERNEDATGGLV